MRNFIETSKSIISLWEMGWLKIKDSEYTSMSLEYFISRIHDESDIEWFGCFRNRKIYLSKVIWKRNFITTNFPFIHDHHGDIYFPLTSRWVVFITWEIDPIITEDESIIYNDFRVSLFNKSFINAHSDNRYIFWERWSDIADMLAL